MTIPFEHKKEICELIIGHLFDTDEEIQKIVIKKRPSLIHAIKNPSEELQLIAVTTRGNTLYNIDSPSRKVIIAAVDNDPNVLQRALTLAGNVDDEEIIFTALNKNGNAIKDVLHQTYDMKITALTVTPAAICFIKFKNDEEKYELYRFTIDRLKKLKENGYDILTQAKMAICCFRTRLPKDMQMEIVKLHPLLIEEIISPDEEVKEYAILNHPEAIDYIIHPSKELKTLHELKWRSNGDIV